MDIVQGTQEQVRNSRGKQAICVRAIEVLLYMYKLIVLFLISGRKSIQARSGQICYFEGKIVFSVVYSSFNQDTRYFITDFRLT